MEDDMSHDRIPFYQFRFSKQSRVSQRDIYSTVNENWNVCIPWVGKLSFFFFFLWKRDYLLASVSGLSPGSAGIIPSAQDQPDQSCTKKNHQTLSITRPVKLDQKSYRRQVDLTNYYQRKPDPRKGDVGRARNIKCGMPCGWWQSAW